MNESRARFTILIPPALYLLLALLLLPAFLYNINPDGIVYITQAEKIVAGHGASSINPCWAPLLSWLLVPLLLLGVPALFAAKWIAILSGMLVLILMGKVIRELGWDELAERVATYSAIPLLLTATHIAITPDLLVVVFLMAHFWMLLRFRKTGAIIDLFGIALFAGMSYYAKSYGLVFSVALTGIWFLLTPGWADRPVDIVKRFLYACAVAAVALLVALPWVVVVSSQLGHLSLSHASTYNFQLFNPELADGGLRPDGLMPPKDDVSTSYWDDFSKVNLPEWQPFQTLGGMLAYVRALFANGIVLVDLMQQVSLFAVAIFGLTFVAILRKKTITAWSIDRGFVLFALFLYLAGYLSFPVHLRYVLFPGFLLLMLGGWMVAQVVDRWKLDRTLERLAILFFMLAALRQPLLDLSHHAGEGKALHNVAASWKEEGLSHKNLASSSDWNRSYYISYYLGTRYYGIPKAAQTPGETLDALNQQNIRLYLSWKGQRPPYADSLWQEVGRDDAIGLSLYERVQGEEE